VTNYLSQTASRLISRSAPMFLGTRIFNTKSTAASYAYSYGRRFPFPKPPRRQFATMAAAIKALNAKIRSNKYTDYFCSTRTFYPTPLARCLRPVESEKHMPKKTREPSQTAVNRTGRHNGLT
jgi:hypothetical protein